MRALTSCTSPYLCTGKLSAVASTYFRRPGVQSYNLTEVESEVLIVDHGLPSDEFNLNVLSEERGTTVCFGQIRRVMEAACRCVPTVQAGVAQARQQRI
jgi:hypothetical protein